MDITCWNSPTGKLVLNAFLHLIFYALWSFKKYVVGGWKEIFLKYRPNDYNAYGVLHREDVTSTGERLQRVRSEGPLHCEHTQVLGCLFQRKQQLSGNLWGSLRSSMCPPVPGLSHCIFSIWKVSKTHPLPDGAVWEVAEPFKVEDTVNSQVTGNPSSKRVVRSCPTTSFVLSGCCELNGLTLNAFWLVTVSEERTLT